MSKSRRISKGHIPDELRVVLQTNYDIAMQRAKAIAGNDTHSDVYNLLDDLRKNEE